MSNKERKTMTKIVPLHYEKHVQRIRNQKTSIKVYFHINKSSKWSYGYLFDLMSEHPRFEPTVYITPEVLTNDERANHKGQCEQLRRFFSERKLPFHMGYDVKTERFLDMFSKPEQSPDIVFYTQLWDTVLQDHPKNVSKYALTCDCLYHAAIAKYGFSNKEQEYYSNLWRFFACTPECRQRHLDMFSTLQSDQVVLTGWPRLDPYYMSPKDDCLEIWPSKMKDRPKVIWAPHWTMSRDPRATCYGTFFWSSSVILDLARQYYQVDWVIKPHPTLWKMIGRENNVINQLLELPNVNLYDDGDYFDLFRSSNALITDSVSFLAEYLPTGHPVIRICDEMTTPLLPPGPDIVKAFYEAKTPSAIEEHFLNVILSGQDPMFSQRMAAKSKYYTPVQPASRNIFDHLLEVLHA